ncbi:hypothetical protein [Aciditerrimonas ferrireducens]|uniref:hypothetical protein n=1 Tax=Aciditerrimonas ferrireducens TaxID=667306 RepID=UPI002005F19C|nr:hypothetical protein [Aciditerrimonas ferrireducens]MCK4177973.1 hypothetical protein [Aciditerrimonas ferrireducens]
MSDVLGERAAEAAGRVDRLLGRLGDLADPEARALAEDLVRAVSDLYGAGLARVVQLTARSAGLPGDHPACGCLEALAEDELVGGLLALHDLHPSDLRARVERAVAGVVDGRDGSDATVLEVDGSQGRVRVRLLVAATSLTGPDQVERRVRRALASAAPELEEVVVERPPAPTPVRLLARR